MAAAVAPNGKVIGIDRDPAMVAKARARLAGRSLVEVRDGDVHALPLEGGSVHRAGTDRVLQHVADPGLTRFITTEIVRNATNGRSLARLCAEAGLSVRSVTPGAPVFRDFETADRILGLRHNVVRAITAGDLDTDARQWIEEADSRPFMATALLFVVMAEAPA
ncbi:methyltransferase domain-containing protein [Actinomadura darangshiensis]|uniref:methyltransferase domain-containing protein n=1 Tax=Actinomadura darangshiensis TaxID=705336 RepID=UPI001A9F541E